MTMGYESLSSIVIVVILVIVMIGWLPKRTVDSMKRVIEHREDKFSSSLHLVDETSGTQFSDTHDLAMKGVVMQRTPSQDSAKNRQHVAQIRGLRRAAARRRRILVLSLLVITLLTLAAAVIWRFSAWYACIPAAVLLAVLGLGIRASRQAVRWERKVARRSDAGRAPHASATAQTSTRGRVDAANHEPREDGEAPTGIMEQREIRRALKRSRDERDRVLAQRRGVRDDGGHGQPEDERPQRANPAEEPAELAVATPVADRREEPADATDELSTVHASHALEAFDMAAQQDLISFSLDASATQSTADGSATGPESLEIKSTKQVAQAHPVPLVPSKSWVSKRDDVDHGEGDGGNRAEQPEISASTDTDASDSHPHRDCDVDAPDPTSDSLGADLQAVLARRAS